MRRKILGGVVVLGGLLLCLSIWGFIAGYAEFMSLSEKTSGNDLDAPIGTYSSMLEKNPQNYAAHLERGIAFAKKKEFSAAIADYTNALEFNSNGKEVEIGILVMRGDAFARTGKGNEALADFDRAIALAPDLTEIYRRRALVRLVTGDFEGAKSDYEKVAATGPDDFNTRYGLAVTAYGLRNWREASTHFAFIRSQDLTNADSAIWLILARKRNGEPIDPVEFGSVNRTTWPGHVVAHLLGEVGPLDKFIDDASAQRDHNLRAYICTGTFATFSLVQIENRLESTAKDYKKYRPDEPYLDSIQEIFERCDAGSLEGRIGQSEIAYLRTH